jgi:hypothetical protein
MPQEPKEEDIQQGIATEPQLPKSYKGRGGWWACEKCLKTVALPEHTFDWTCEQCKTKMYTTPLNECPLERFRRFVLDTGQKMQINATEKAAATSGDDNSTKEETIAK